MKIHNGASVWPDGFQTRTFRFGPRLLADFYQLAASLQLNPSELACYLLRQALDQVAAGRLRVPTRPIGAVIDDGGRARE